jgi:hypothetical protein
VRGTRRCQISLWLYPSGGLDPQNPSDVQCDGGGGGGGGGDGVGNNQSRLAPPGRSPPVEGATSLTSIPPCVAGRERHSRKEAVAVGLGAGSTTPSGTILTERTVHAARNSSGKRYPIAAWSHPEGGRLTSVTHATGVVWYPATVDGERLTLVGTKFGYGPISDKTTTGTLVSNAKGSLAIEDADGVVHQSIGHYTLADGRVVCTKRELEGVNLGGALVYNVVRIRRGNSRLA